MSLYGGVHYPDLLRYVATVLICFQIGLIALVIPSLTSATISSEIENTTFETLRLSRLRGGQIFWGKFLPAVLPALLPVIALLPAYAALAYVQTGYIAYFLNVLPVILLAVLFCVSMGLVCSAFFAQTARATVMAYLISSALFILPVITWMVSGQLLSQHLGAQISFLSPLVMALSLLPPPEGQPADPMSQLLANYYSYHLYFMAALCVGLIVAARLRVSRLLQQG
jgi:ABC-type Na+ efflux pump permease subunit